ncbi:MAG: hypothetical protein RL213_849 [Bacteroidota bacterium]|jgi:hypothetical protein
MSSRSVVILVVALFSFRSLSAQQFGGDGQKTSLKDRIYFGGNFGLQFGTQTVIDINPICGYRLTPKFSAGIGVKYLYYRYKDRYQMYETDIYGGSVFGRYEVTQSIFAYSEYELINLAVFDPYERRIDIGSMFVGGGYSQRLGGRSSIYLMVLFNLNESSYSPYDNPVFRMGVGIGI